MLIDLALDATTSRDVRSSLAAKVSICAGIDIDPSQMDMQYDTRTLQQELRCSNPSVASRTYGVRRRR